MFFLLSHYCKSFPVSRLQKRRETKNISIYFNTRALPCLTEIYSKFYKETLENGKILRKKVIPKDIFFDLNPIVLAFWIMGDGAVRSHGLLICTDSYTIPDVILLINCLRIKFDLEVTLQFSRDKNLNKEYPRIYFPASQMSKLQTLVYPFMEKSMLYKIHL